MKDKFLGARAFLRAAYRLTSPNETSRAVEEVHLQAGKVEEAAALLHSIATKIIPATMDEAVRSISEDM